jgi:hypothetical protein
VYGGERVQMFGLMIFLGWGGFNQAGAIQVDFKQANRYSSFVVSLQPGTLVFLKRLTTNHDFILIFPLVLL